MSTGFALTVISNLILTGCVTMPSQTRDLIYGDSAFQVQATECRAKSESKKSLIILPPTGGTNLIDRSYIKRFCNGGYDVYLLNDWSRPDKSNDLAFHQREYTNSQRAIALTLARIKTPFVGLLGTSVGATHAAVAANTFEQLDAVMFIVGGVPIPQVIVTSDHPSMKALHKSRFERFKFENDAAYESALNNAFALEPTRLGDIHLKKDFAAVIALSDSTVPVETQKNLVEFFKPQKVITLPNSHFWAILKTWLSHTKEIVAFFDESSARKINSKP